MKKYFISFLMLILLSISTFAQINIEIEAENAISSGNYEIIHNENASNGTFIKSFSTGTTGSLSFDINGITLAGTYKLELFSFNNNVEQTIDISINGGASSSATLQESNWAFEGTAKSTYLNITLITGNNTVTISTPYVTVLFDKFRVTDNYNVYYISSSIGLDTNDGSVNAPWQTIDKATAVAEKPSNGGLLNPGDKLLFKSGDIFYGHFNVKCSGSVIQPIELSSYGPGEKPIFSGSGGTIIGGDWFEAIILTNTSNLLLTNLWVKNDRQDDSRYTYGEYSSFGIKVVANQWGGIISNLTFRDLHISDVFGISLPPPSEFNSLKATGIRFEAEANEDTIDIAITDVLIEDCYFTHIGKAGVWAIHKGTADDATINRNQNFVIRNNTFFQTGGSGVILSKTYNALVENNDFDHTGYSTASLPKLAGRGSGMWVWGCRNVIAQYNRSYSIRGPGDSYGMHMDFGNKNIIFQYNYSEDSEGGFCEILGDNYNCTYRFNVSVNDGFRDFHGYTLWISGYAGSGNTPIRSDKNYIYNNTIFLNDNNYTPRISIFAGDTYVYNNIIMAVDGAKIGYNSAEGDGVSIDVGSHEFIMENNLFEGDIHNNLTSEDSNSETGSPLFLNEGNTSPEDYRILYGSPAINSGISFNEPSFPNAGTGIFANIPPYPTKDFYGNPIDLSSGTPNIGACNDKTGSLDLNITSGIKTISNNVNYHDVNVSPGASIIVESGVTLNTNNVNLESNSSSFSSLINYGTLTGTFNYSRFVNEIGTTNANNDGNDLISAPVIGQTFSSFVAANTNLATSGTIAAFAPFNIYTTSPGAYENFDTLTDGGTTLDSANGYRAATVDGSPLIFSGNINSESVSKSIDVSSGNYWNLVGNPYPSYLDTASFLNASNLSKLADPNKAIYGYNGNGWQVVNLANANSFKIAPGQGFFLASNGTGSINFNKDIRTTGSSDDFISGKVSEANKALAKIQLLKGNDTFNTDVYFIENQTRGLDPAYDAGAYQDNAEGIYTHLVEDNEGIEIAIQALDYADLNNIIIPLGVKANSGEQITLHFDETTSTLPENINLYLEDTLENTMTLLNNCDYSITLNEDLSDTGRYFLRFSTETLSVSDKNLSSVQIYTPRNSKSVVIKGALTSSTHFSIYDIQGRLVLERNLDFTTNSITITLEHFTSGIYVVQIENETLNKTQKIILK